MRKATYMVAYTGIRATRNLLTACLLFSAGIATAGIWEEGDIEAGQALFNANCASCHKVTAEVLAAPGLAGIADRWGASDEMLVKWIQNPQAAAEEGDGYIKSIVSRYVPTYGWMTAQAVSADDIKNIMAYVQNPPDVAPVTDAGSQCPTVDEMGLPAEEGGSGVWFLILLVLFLIIALSAAGVNRSLTNAVNKDAGEDLLPELPYGNRIQNWAWDNRVVVSLIVLFFASYGAVLGYQGLMRVGVVEGYKPNQPIQFIHSVHVCENEVDCKYCHTSAYESKHAGIPSTNVCMNCHKAVKKGRRAGETEIAKIYEAIGFDATTATYVDGDGKSGYALPQDSFDGEPIRWNKVHNLPDHVYFSHQQHVVVGGLHCQNCHGDVETYTVGRVAKVDDINQLVDKYPGLIELSKPTLTMGWCIECHNKAEIDLASSGYYEEIHLRLKDNLRGNEELRKYLEDEKITVKELGGWECAKCHY
ncbi:MAG: cytochrome c3 family protein [Flavobacteriales bacterium]